MTACRGADLRRRGVVIGGPWICPIPPATTTGRQKSLTSIRPRATRKAAIKVLLPEVSANKEIVQRFFNEARATAVIRHSGLSRSWTARSCPTGARTS